MFEKRICATAPCESVADKVSVDAVVLVAAAPPLITTLPVGDWLSTVTLTVDEVCVFPDVSRALAVRTCVPGARGGGVPGHRVRRRRVLRPQVRPVEQELHARDRDDCPWRWR